MNQDERRVLFASLLEKATAKGRDLFFREIQRLYPEQLSGEHPDNYIHHRNSNGAPSGFRHKRSTVGIDVIIETGAVLKKGASAMFRSVIHEGVLVDEGGYIGRECDIGPWTEIGKKASLEGYNTVGEGAILKKNAKVREWETIPPHFVYESSRRSMYDEPRPSLVARSVNAASSQYIVSGTAKDRGGK